MKRFSARQASRLFKKTAGMTLVELIVTIGILSVIVAGAFQVFREGLELFRTNQAAADAQSSAIKTLSKITAELVNADPRLVAVYSTPGEIDGVVFASPLDANGVAQFHSQTGKIYWQRYICYYHVPNLNDDARGQLFRREEVIPDEVGIEVGRTGSTNVADVEAGMASRTTSYFAASSALPTRLLGDSVSGFECKDFVGQVDDGIGGTKQVLGGALADRDRSVDVILEAGDKNNDGRDGYFIKVNSRVTPRG